MSDEKENSFGIRDQFAIAAMTFFLQIEDNSVDPICSSYINEHDRYNHNHNFVKIDDLSIAKMDRIANAAYKMADSMRRARLKVFD